MSFTVFVRLYKGGVAVGDADGIEVEKVSHTFMLACLF